MDISSAQKVTHEATVPYPVPLPDRLLTPWMRLAHISGSPPQNQDRPVRLRVIRDFELVLPLEGTSWMWFDPAGGSVDLEEGSIAFIPPGYVHNWAGVTGSHIAVHFDLHARTKMAHPDQVQYLNRHVCRRPIGWIPRFVLRTQSKQRGGEGRYDAWEPILPFVTPLRRPQQMRERLEPLVHIWSRRAHRTTLNQLFIAETIGWALRTIAEDAARMGEARSSGAEPRLTALIHEINQPQTPVYTVEELAEKAGMGLTSFRAAFTRAVGRTPRVYMEELRIERAGQALLETDRPVFEIARELGYHDPYHFSRAFKRVTGHSPRHYRRRARG